MVALNHFTDLRGPDHDRWMHLVLSMKMHHWPFIDLQQFVSLGQKVLEMMHLIMVLGNSNVSGIFRTVWSITMMMTDDMLMCMLLHDT